MNRQARPTAVLADDERLMRELLRRRLAEVWPELEVVAEATNGSEAIAAVAAHRPDIAFLDIQMPEKTGLEAAGVISGQCHIVFVTAYDQHAIEAFERGATDYVLKPANPERLKLTCERLKEKLEATPGEVEQLLARIARQMTPGAKPDYLRWIQASIGNSLRMIPTREILFFRSDDKYTRVQTPEFEALIRKPIKELATELDPDEFWQIHRSILVRVEAVAQIQRDERGQQIVSVKGHPEKLEVSRAYSQLFRHM
ncbi:MAG: response regulator transcription factor [Betaproteobacteria bacterium]|nr:response regulator transcription factor [Betaproteobacteria bacterium]